MRRNAGEGEQYDQQDPDWNVVVKRNLKPVSKNGLYKTTDEEVDDGRKKAPPSHPDENCECRRSVDASCFRAFTPLHMHER